jgi:integrase
LRIEQRYNRWLTFMDVPEDVRPILGKNRFVASLKTGDKALAKRRAAVLEAQWRGLIQQARQQAQAADPILERGLWWRQGWKPEHAEALEMEANDMEIAGAMRRGIYDYSDPRFEEVPERKDALRLRAIATGKLIRTDERLDEYLAVLKDQIEPKTVDLKRSTIKAFATEFPLLADIQRPAVQQWIYRQAQAGKARATIVRVLSDMRRYWAHLQSLRIVADEHLPLDGRRLQVPKPSKKGRDDDRKAFTAAEVVALHAAALESKDQRLADLIELAMYTGARIEELCAFPVEKVHANYFDIADAKTKAGLRTVPIHSALQATVARLLRESKDGYLLSGLVPDKYDDRSQAMSKRFGRLKTRHRFGPQHVFHSIRKTVATLLENAGVSDNVINDTLGWEKKTMIGRYSSGIGLQLKQEAIEKLRYPIA